MRIRNIFSLSGNKIQEGRADSDVLEFFRQGKQLAPSGLVKPLILEPKIDYVVSGLITDNKDVTVKVFRPSVNHTTTTSTAFEITFNSGDDISGWKIEFSRNAPISSFNIRKRESVPPLAPSISLPAPTQPEELQNTISIKSGQEWYARIPESDRITGSTYSLSSEPLGMRVQKDTGYLRWTPDQTQVGSHSVTLTTTPKTGTVTTKTLNLTVSLGTNAPTDGYYVTKTGTTKGTGTLSDPIDTIKNAYKKMKDEGYKTRKIYIRGGLYLNEEWGEPFSGRQSSSVVNASDIPGTEESPIIFQNFGNEYVTIQSDVSGIALRDSTWVEINGLEFKGNNAAIDVDYAIARWWMHEGPELTGLRQSGIITNACTHVLIKDCVVTEFAGDGITHNWGEYVTVEDCVIAHNARWSVGGVHGWSNSKPGTGDKTNPTDVKIAARRNVVWDAQQCIFSRVFSKGFSDFVIDEGGGLHTQAQKTLQDKGGVVFGYWDVSDNLVGHCGKSGVNQNLTGNLRIYRNSFFQNVYNTTSANIHLNPFKDTDAAFGMNQPIVSNNLVHALPNTRSVNKLGDVSEKFFDGWKENYIRVGGADADKDFVENTPIRYASEVFTDPSNGNFSSHASIPDGFGVDDSILANMAQKLEEYGVTLTPCPVDTSAIVNKTTGETYQNYLARKLIESWPNPATASSEWLEEVGADFEIHVNGFHYTYATKDKYPNDPAL